MRRAFSYFVIASFALCGAANSTTPQQLELMRAFNRAELLGRVTSSLQSSASIVDHADLGTTDDQSISEVAFSIQNDVWRALEHSGLCYGDDRASRVDWRWAKCGPHSLHPKPGGPFQVGN
jgi:hypothetical protein